jgi:hypothetical protein
VFSYLKINGDPTVWELADPVQASPLAQPGATFSISVVKPLTGTLLLSRTSPGVAVFNTNPSGAIVPSGSEFGTPVLYLPSPTGLVGGQPVYPLPPGTNLTKLVGEISAALSAGSELTIDFTGGVLTLNGATVRFVVVCPPGETGAIVPSADEAPGD